MSKNKVQLVLDVLGSKRVQGEIGKIQGRLRGLKDSVFSLKTAIAGLGMGLVAKSFIEAADTTEQFSTRLKILLGSVEEGNRLFREMTDYASRVPFEYEEIMASATQLAGVMKGGVDEIKTWMPLIGDLAAASGLSIQETTEQVIRMYSAGAAAADKFRERGILAMLGFKAGVSYTAEETRKKLFEEWQKADSQFKGATVELATTWKGQLSMMADKWFQFRTKVMESAPFEHLRASIELLNGYLEKNGESIDEYAERIGKGIVDVTEKVALGTAGLVDTFSPIIETIWDSLNDTWDSFRSLPPWVQQVGLVGAVVGGKKGAVVVMGLARLIDSVRNSARGFSEVISGDLTMKEFSRMNADDLRAYLDGLDKQAKENLPGLGSPGAPEGSFRARLQAVIDRIRGMADASRSAGEELRENLGGGKGSGVGEAISALKELGAQAEKTKWKVAEAASGPEAPGLDEVGPGVLHAGGPTMGYKEAMESFRQWQQGLLKGVGDGKKSLDELKAEAESIAGRLKQISLGDINSEAAIEELNRLRERYDNIREQLRVLAEPRLKLEALTKDIEAIKDTIGKTQSFIEEPKTLNIDTSPAMRGIVQMRTEIDRIPDVIRKTLILEYRQVASPEVIKDIDGQLADGVRRGSSKLGEALSP